MGTERNLAGWTRRALVPMLGLTLTIGAVAVLPVEAELRAKSTVLEDPDPLEVDRDQERMADAIDDSERITEDEGSALDLPAGAAPRPRILRCRGLCRI